MKLARSLRTLSVLGVLVMAGCEREPHGPAAALTGHYELVSANGEPLPFRYYVSEPQDGSPTVVKDLLAASIEGMSRGRLMDVRSVAVNGFVQPTDSGAYAYTLEQGQIVIPRPMLYAPDSYADTGQLVGDGLMLKVRYVRKNDVAANLVLQYVRR